MTVLNTAYGHMTHKIFTNLPKTILNHGKPHQMEHFGESKSTFVNMTWIDILEFLLWNMEMIVSFNRGEYFILMVPFQFKCSIRFIGLQEFQNPKFTSMKPKLLNSEILLNLRAKKKQKCGLTRLSSGYFMKVK